MLPAASLGLLEHDLQALGRLVPTVLPAFERRAQEAGGNRLVLRVPDPVGPNEDAVLEHRRALLVEVDDHQVLGLYPRVAHLLVLVVGHGGSGIDLLLEEKIHVVRLRDQGHVSVPVDLVLLQRGEQLELAAAEPYGDAPATEIGGALDAGRLQGDLAHAAVGEQLRDVHERRAPVPRGEEAREPADPKLRAAAHHDLLGDHVWPAWPNRDVELLGRVDAFGPGRVVPGELRLRDPSELELHLVGGLSATFTGCPEDRQAAHEHRQQGSSSRHGRAPLLSRPPGGIRTVRSTGATARRSCHPDASWPASRSPTGSARRPPCGRRPRTVAARWAGRSRGTRDRVAPISTAPRRRRRTAG